MSMPLNDDTLDDYRRETLAAARKQTLADMTARLNAAVKATPPEPAEQPDRVASTGLSGLVTGEQAAKPDPDREWWDTLDVARQSMRGLAQAGLEIGQTVVDVGQAVGVPGADSADAFLDDQKNLVAQTYGEASSVAGAVARPLAQLAGGAAALAPVAAASGATKALQGANALVRAGASGSLVGAVAFDPHEERLSNLLQDTRLANPLTEWLATQEDDSALEGRLKSAVENAGVGVALHGAANLVKTIARHARNRRAVFTAENTTTVPQRSAITAAEDVEVARAAIKDIRSRIGSNPKGGDLDKLKAAKEEFKQLRDRALQQYRKYQQTDEYRRLDPRVRARLDAMVDGREAQLMRANTAAMQDELGRRAIGRVAGDLAKGLDVAAARTLIRNGMQHTDAAARAFTDNFNVGIMDFEDTGQIAVLGEAIRSAAAAVEKLSPAPGKSGHFMERTGRLITELVGNVDPAELVRRGAALARDVKDAGALMTGLEVVAKKMALDAATLGKQIAAMGDAVTPELEAQFVQAVRNVQAFMAPLKGIQRETARAVASRALRKGFRADSINLDVLDRAISEEFVSRANLLRVARKVAAADGEAASVLKAMEKPRNPIRNAIREYYVNSLLYGPITQAVNITGNAMKMLWDPVELGVEQFWKRVGEGAGVKTAFGDAAGEAKAAYGAFLETSVAFVRSLAAVTRMGTTEFAKGLPTGLTGAFDPRSMALNVAEAARTGRSQLTRTSSTEVGQAAITADALLGDSASTMLRAAVDWAGTIVRLPTRGMTIIDEAFSNLNFFMHARREAYRIGRQRGFKGDALQDFMRRFVDEADTETLDAVAERSIASARRNVWQEELGHFGKSAQGLIHADPTGVLPVVVPFFRTPVNIMKYGFKRNPVVLAFEGFLGKNKIARKFIFGTPEGRRALLATPEGADFAGRLTTSMMLTGAAIATFDDSWITGRAPTDQDKRAAWEATGRQAYSIRIGDKWISYGRLDPFGMMLGLMADFTLHGPEMFSEGRTHDEDPDAYEIGAWGVWASFSEMLRSRNYLQGATQLIAAVTDPEARGDFGIFVTRLAGGFVPNIISQTEGTLDFGVLDADPVRRDARVYGTDGRLDMMRTLVQNLASRAGSDDVPRKWTAFGPARRATGVGWDLVSPFLATQAREGEFPKLLSRVGKSPALDDYLKEFKSFTIPTEARDRLGELMTTVKINGKTLAEMGEQVANDPRLAKLPPRRMHGAKFRTQEDVLSELFLRYRDEAVRALFAESPSVKEQFTAFKQAATRPDTLTAILEY